MEIKSTLHKYKNMKKNIQRLYLFINDNIPMFVVSFFAKPSSREC